MSSRSPSRCRTKALGFSNSAWIFGHLPRFVFLLFGLSFFFASVEATPNLNINGSFQAAEPGRTHMDVGGVWDGTQNIAPQDGDDFSVSIVNTGSGAANNFVASLVLPNAFSFPTPFVQPEVTLGGSGAACGNSLPPHTFVISGNTVSLDFSGNFNLPPSCTLGFSVPAFAAAGTTSGTYRVENKATYNFNNSAQQVSENTNVLVLAGGLLVDKSLAAGQSDSVVVGDEPEFSIQVTNPGPGAIFDVVVTDTGTAELPFLGYSAPLPNGVSQNPNDSSQFGISYIPAGDVFSVETQSRVASCTNLVNRAEGQDINGGFSSDEQSLKIDLETPLIDVTFTDPFQLSFLGPTLVTLDVASTGLGDAEDLEIDVDLGSQAQFVRMISANWTYTGGTFSYDLGTLVDGDSTQIVFEVEPIQHCVEESASSFASLQSRYNDQCGNAYSVPGKVFSLAGMNDIPDAEIIKTLQNRRIENGESSSFTIAPSLSNAQNLDPIVTITDVLPSNLESIGDASGNLNVPAGTSYTCNGSLVCNPGDTLVWTIDLRQTGGQTPALIIPFKTFDNVCTGGDYLSNTASIQAQSVPVGVNNQICSYQDSEGAYGIITNNIAGSTSQRFNVDASPAVGGSFETGLADGTGSSDGTRETQAGEGEFIPFLATYVFNDGTPSLWSSLRYQDDFGRADIEPHQTLVPDSLQVRITDTTSNADSGWVTLGTGDFTRDSNGLGIDFADLVGNGFGNLSNLAATVDTYQLDIRYQTTITDAVLNGDGYREHNQVATLSLDAGDFGACVGRDITYTTGTFVQTIRADAEISVSMPPAINVCQPFDLTLNINETRTNGLDIHDLVASLDLSGSPYQVQGTPSYTGELASGTSYPSSTPVDGNQVFSNPNEWTGGNNGQIRLPLIQITDQGTTPASLNALVDYQDNQGTVFNLSSSTAPVLVNSADLVITVTPQSLVFSGNSANWKIYVTNTGAAPAVNTVLSHQLHSDLILDEAGTNAANPVPVQFGGANPALKKDLFWNLETIDPGTSAVIEVNVFAPVSQMCDGIDSPLNDVQAAWGCGGTTESAPHKSSPSFIFPTASLDVAHDTSNTICPLCSDTATVAFTLTNTGKRSLFNVSATEDIGTDEGQGLALPAAGADLYEFSINGTTWTAFTPTSIDRTAGIFVVDSSSIPQLAELYRLNDANGVDRVHQVQVRYRVQVSEPAAMMPSGPAITLDANAEVACGPMIEESQSDNIDILVPELNLNKLGTNMTLAGASDPQDLSLTYSNTVYGIPGDLVSWRMQVSNTGDVEAQSVRLQDILPNGGASQTVQSIVSNCALSGLPASFPIAGSALPTFALEDLAINQSCNVYITTTLGANCTNGANEATASFSCSNPDLNAPSILPDANGNGLDTSGSHNDTANLRMTPNFGAGNAIRQTLTNLAGGQKDILVRVRNLGARATLNTYKNELPAGMMLVSDVTFTNLAGTTTNLSFPAGTNSFEIDLNGETSRNRDEFEVRFRVGPVSHQDLTQDPLVNPETAANGLDPQAPAAGQNLVTVNFTPGCGAAMENTDSVNLDLATPDLDIRVLPDTQLAIAGGTNQFNFIIEQNGDNGSIAESINGGAAEPITFVPTLGAGWTLNGITVGANSGASGVTCGATQCTIERMNAGASLTLTVDASLSDTSQPLTTIGTVTGPYDGANSVNYSLDTVRARVVGANLEKSLIASNQDFPAHPSADMLVGEQQTWRLTGQIFGLDTNDVVSNIQLYDVLPAGLGFVSYTDNAAGLSVTSDTNPGAINTGSIVFNLSDASAPGGAFSIDLTTQVLNNAASANGSTQTNTADLSFDLLGENFNADDHPSLRATEDIRVLRPNLAVEKSVRKVGGTYGSTASGDAGDAFEYRIQIRNTGDAPLFSLDVQDLLADPTSDIQVTAGSFGEDSSGNGAVDQNFGTLSTVGGAHQLDWNENSTGASASMAMLPAGGTLNLVYRTVTQLAVAPGERLENTVSVSGDTLPDRLNNPNPSAQHATLTQNDAAEIIVMDAEALVKQIKRTSQTALISAGASQPLVIGEQVEFSLSITLPEGTTPNLTFRDAMPANLSLVGTPTAILGDAIDGASCALSLSGSNPAGGNTSLPLPATGPQNLFFTFSPCVVAADNSAANRMVEVRYIAQVRNASMNQDGSNFNNSAAFTTDPATIAFSPEVSVDMEIHEPNLVAAKSATPDANLDSQDTVTYTISFENQGSATAHNVVVTDTLPSGLVFTAEPLTSTSDVAAPAAVFANGNTEVSVGAGQSLSIPSGQTLSFNLKARLTDAVELNQQLTNQVQSTWTSLDNLSTGLDGLSLGASGSDLGARDGSGSPAHNDQNASAQATLTAGKPASFSKALVTPLPTTGGFRVGDLVTYRLNVELMEGTTEGVTLRDTLPTGMTFVSTDPITPSAPFSFTPPASPSQGATGSLEWNFGQVLNQGDADQNQSDTNNGFSLTYTAVVSDVAALPVSADAIRLTNAASLTFLDVNDSAQLIEDAVDIDVVQPVLALAKSIPTGGPEFYAANDPVTFEISITNSGSGPAFGPVIEDVLPLGLNDTALPITATNGAGLSVAATEVSSTSATKTIAFDLSGQVIEPNETFTFSYEVLLNADVGPNFQMTNAASLTSFCSLPDGDAQEGARRCQTPDLPPAEATLTTKDVDGIFKSVGQDSIQVGDLIQYSLSLPASGDGTVTPAGVALYNVKVSDTLDSGLSLESVVVTDDQNTVLGYTGSDAGNQLDIRLDDPLPADRSVRIELQARVLDLGANADGKVFSNQANFSFASTEGGDQASDRPSNTVTTVLVEPVLELEKSLTDSTETTREVAAGETLSYTLEVENTGTGTAFNYVLQDILPEGLNDAGATTLTATLVDASNNETPIAIPPQAVADGNVPNVITWTFAGSALQAGEKIKLSYSLVVDADIGADQNLRNTARVLSYQSNVDGDADETRDYGPSEEDSLIVQTPGIGGMVKESDVATANVGDLITYTITLPTDEANQPELLDTIAYDVILSDQLPDGLKLINASAVSVDAANTQTPLVVSSDGDTGDIQVDIGDVPAQTYAIITLITRVQNVPEVTTNTVMTNRATYSFATSDGGDPTEGGGDSAPPVEISEPALSVDKTAHPTEHLTFNGQDGQLARGDEVMYRLQLTNEGDGTAFNATLIDRADLGLINPTVVTASIDGTTVTLTGPTSSLAPAGDANDWSWNLPAPLLPDQTLTADIRFVIDDTADLRAFQTLSNTALTSWTSTETPNDDTRNGTSEAPDPVTVELAGPSFEKTFADDQVSPVAVGDLVTYHLTLDALNLAFKDLTFIDTLPAGMAYHSHEIFSQTDVQGFDGSTVASPTLNDATPVLRFAFGDVMGTSAVAELVLAVRAFVVADDALETGQSFTNTASVEWTDPTGTPEEVPSENEPTFDIAVPGLSLAKTLDPATPGPFGAGETATFNIVVTNTSTISAFDPVFVDTLPNGFDDAAPTNASLAATQSFEPANGTDPARVTWTSDAGVEIPAGESLNFSYQVTFDADVGALQTLENQIQLVQFQSIPANDENGDEAQVFTPDLSGSAEVQTLGAGGITKTVNAAEAAIGQTLTYELFMPTNDAGEPTPASVQLNDVRVWDTLPAGLRLDSVTATLDGAEATFTGTPGTADFDLLFAAIPANQILTLTFEATVLNLDATQQGAVLANTANYEFASETGGDPVDQHTSNTVETQIIEPTLEIEKSHRDAEEFTYTSQDGVLGRGDTVLFDLSVRNTSGATAHEVTILELADANFSALTVQNFSIDGNAQTLSGSSDFVSPPTSGDAWTWASGQSLDPDQVMVVTVAAVIDPQAALGPFDTLSNAAEVAWSSGTADNEDARDSYKSETTPAVSVSLGGLSFAKTLAPDQSESVLPGTNATYHLTISSVNLDLQNLSIVDLVPPGMEYAGHEFVTTQNVGTLALPMHTIGQSPLDANDVTFDFGNVSGTGGAIEIVLAVDLLLTYDPANVPDLQLTNTAHAQTLTDGEPAPEETDPSGATITVLPLCTDDIDCLALSKTASDATQDPVTGLWSVDFQLVVQNIGPIDLTDVSLKDDVVDQLLAQGAASAQVVAGSMNGAIDSDPAGTSTLVVNMGFDGTNAGQNDLLVPSGSSLAIDAAATVNFRLVFDAAGQTQYENTAVVSGTMPNGESFDEESMHEGETGPTPIPMPSVGLAKQLISFQRVGGGYFDAGFEFTLQNTGNTNLSNVQVSDDVATQLYAQGVEAGSVLVVTPPSVFFSSDGASALLSNGANFTGQSGAGANLLIGGADSVLAAGEIAKIRVTVRFRMLANGTLSNSAVVIGTSPNGTPVSDVSTDGSNPDPDGDNNPHNNDEPTLMRIDPTGVVYDALNGSPVAGAIVTLVNASGQPLPASCLAPNQQGQTTAEDGTYRFDVFTGLNASCPSSETNYKIRVSPPAGYSFQSVLVPPAQSFSPSFTAPANGTFDVTGCPEPAQLVDFQCQMVDLTTAPLGGVEAASPANLQDPTLNSDFHYFLDFAIAAGDPTTTNNHIPLDPAAAPGDIGLSKAVLETQVTMGDFVNYTLIVENLSAVPQSSITLEDKPAAGFTYVVGSTVVTRGTQTASVEPSFNGGKMLWQISPTNAVPMDQLASGETMTLRYKMRVGTRADMGVFKNIAVVSNNHGTVVSPVAEASVRIGPDPVLDCPDLIGQVYYDRNRNGYQDGGSEDGENGVARVRIGTMDGREIITDANGRFHLTCPIVPNADRGSNYQLKVDVGSLPSGYRLTSENPRVVRMTRGKVTKANFGVSVSRVVTIELDERSFVAGATNLTPWAANEIALVWPWLHRHGEATMRLVYNLSPEESAQSSGRGWSRLADARMQNLSKALRDGWQKHSLNGSKNTRRWRLRKKDVEIEMVDRHRGIAHYRNVQRNLEQTPKHTPELDAVRRMKDPIRISFAGRFINQVSDEAHQNGQRYVDRVLAGEDLQIRFDGLDLVRHLNMTARVERDETGRMLRFTPYWNYDHFIKRAELRLFNLASTSINKPVSIIPLQSMDFFQMPLTAETRGEFGYVLRVYDEQGRFDETKLESISVRTPDDDYLLFHANGRDRPDFAGYGTANLARTNIPINGGMVTTSGINMRPNSMVTVMGALIPVNPRGKFVTQQILPYGPHLIGIVVDTTGEAPILISRRLEVEQNSLFYTVHADATLGQKVTKVEGQDKFRETFTEGRLAFYLKGKVRGDVLITAMGDTGEGELKTLFSDLHATDPASMLRRIDPDKHYPVYGDGSTVRDDTPTNGKLYVRVERNDSYAVLGNFKAGLHNTSLLDFNRSLYGVKGHLQMGQTRFGDPRVSATAFAAKPDSAHAQDRLRGTGGSVYYLKHRDIIRGSENLRIEIRNKDTGIVESTQPLVYEDDFVIDSFQGRIILNKPLASTVLPDSILADSSLDGHHVFLLVDYDYVPSSSDDDARTVGGEVDLWVLDQLRLGVSGYETNTGNDDQTGLSASATFRPVPDVSITAEIAESEGKGLPQSQSTDGGFTFIESVTTAQDKAKGVNVEAQVDLNTVTNGRYNAQASAYYQDLEAGFKGRGSQVTNDTQKIGGKVEVELTPFLSVGGSIDEVRTAGAADQRVIEVHADMDISDLVAATIALGQKRNGTQKTEEVAAKLTYENELTGRTAYVFGKTDLDGDDTRFGVGGDIEINDRMRLGGEISNSSKTGVSAKVNGQYAWTNSGTVYAGYELKQSQTAGSTSGLPGEIAGDLTLGIRQTFGKVSLYGEERVSHVSNRSTGLMHGLGIDYAPFDHVRLSLSGEAGKVEQVDRRALAASASYNRPQFNSRLALEYRQDTDQSGIERTQVAAFANVKAPINPSFSLRSYLDYAASNTNAVSTQDDSARFVEGSLGLAYRPVNNDRFNGLLRYTYLYDLPPVNQENGQVPISTTGFKQRSHILSADGTWRINRHLDVGAKYGLKIGEQTASRTDKQWFRNETHLGVVRGDIHFVHDWDALIEGRVLYQPEAEDLKLGGLAAIYRHLGHNAKVGVGFNASKFSDNLIDPNRNDYGWFLNVTGKF